MTELRELARGVVQQGVGRLRRRVLGLASLVGIDVDAVRSAAQRAIDTAQGLRSRALPARPPSPLPDGAPYSPASEAPRGAGAASGPIPGAPASAPAAESSAPGRTSSGRRAGAPKASGPSAEAPAPVQGGFFQGGSRSRPGLPDGAQLRLFARDAWTLFALWEVGPGLAPPGAADVTLELWLRPVGGAVVERLQVPLSGRRYFEGLVPGRTYLAELWWRTPGGEAEPVAVVPRTATLPVIPSGEALTEPSQVRFVRVEWDGPSPTEAAASPSVAATRGPARPRGPTITQVAAPSLPGASGVEGLSAAVRVGWAGSPDLAGRSLRSPTSPQGRLDSSPSKPWSGSPDRPRSGEGLWAGSPGRIGPDGRYAPPLGVSGATSPGAPGLKARRSPHALSGLIPNARPHVPAPEPLRGSRIAREPEQQAAPITAPARGDHRPGAVPPTHAAAAAPRRKRQTPRAGTHQAAPTPPTPVAPLQGGFFQPTGGSEGPEAAVKAGFFVARHAPAARQRRSLAPAREGEPLASAETPRRRG